MNGYDMRTALVAVLLLAMAPGAFAQNFPGKPIRIVVGYPAGGSTGLIARLVAEPMSKALGQPVIIDNRPGAAGQIGSALVAKAGKPRPIAISSAQRSSLMPCVPTVAEAGLAGFEVDYWNGIMAPAHTPAAVIEALNKAIGLALEYPELEVKMAVSQLQPTHSKPARFGALVQNEIANWTDVVQTAGIVAQ